MHKKQFQYFKFFVEITACQVLLQTLQLVGFCCSECPEKMLQTLQKVHAGRRELTLKRSRNNDQDGMCVLSKLMQTLDEFEFKRSEVQKQLHRGMVGAVLQKIFEYDSDASMRMGMNRHRIQSSRQQFMAITPRRFGKTTAVSMFVAAFAVTVAGSVTAIFSTGRRASNLLLQQIKAMLMQIPGIADRIVSCNVETIVLSIGDKLSKISSYPGKAKT